MKQLAEWCLAIIVIFAGSVLALLGYILVVFLATLPFTLPFVVILGVVWLIWGT